VVVVEGFKGERLPKIEVFRRVAHDRALWDPDRDDAEEYIAGITDDPAYRDRAPFPTFDAEDPHLDGKLADLVQQVLRLG
jgi:molybdopterin-guanine dinucleotide biosynthesis protein